MCKKKRCSLKNIDIDFQNAKGKSILFLGHFNSLSKEEIELFLEKFDISYKTTLDDDVIMAIEGTILSVFEEESATQAYQKKIPIYGIDQFDRLYAKKLDSDSILMTLKLSNDKERLFRLMHNPYLGDRLFLKLFSTYDWKEDGMFDNSDNMKISTLFAKRFLKKDRFDSAAYYSPVSIFEVAQISKNPDVLEVMFDLPDLRIKRSKNSAKKPMNLKEAIAANPFTNEKTLKKAFMRNDENIDYFLAQNPSISIQMQESIYKRANNRIKEALCKNENLINSLFEKLIDFETLWKYQPVDEKKLTLIKTPPPCIGENEKLSQTIIDLLIDQKDEKTLKNLCTNPILNQNQLQKIYELNNKNLYPLLAAHPNSCAKILYKLFEEKNFDIDLHLALNPSAPKDILKTLFQRDDFEINKRLSLNETLDIESLQQLQIDHRLLNYLKENKTFTQNILNNLGI